MTSDLFGSTNVARPKVQKMSEQVARRIVDVIMANRLAPGTRLPVESELGEKLGVGRNTLREALRLLEAWGVVEIKQGRNGGPTVRHPRPQDLRQALTVQLLFAAATLEDILDARGCVEPHSAMLATTRMTDEQIAALSTSVQRMRDHADNQDIFLEENRSFHEQIAACSGNVVIHAFVDAMKSIFDGAAAGVAYKPARRLAVADAHERIVAALASRDPEAARQEMELHLREAGDYWRSKGEEINHRVGWAV